MKRISILLFFALSFLFACDKEEVSSIPYAPVRLDLDLDFEDVILQSPLGYKSFTKPRRESDVLGYGGIIVCHGLLESSNAFNLWAFDMACPVEASSSVKIVPDDPKGSNTAVKASCPKCGAVYDLTAGGIALSGSKYNLVHYPVNQVSGSNRFRVGN